jgi:hypothetical protein
MNYRANIHREVSKLREMAWGQGRLAGMIAAAEIEAFKRWMLEHTCVLAHRMFPGLGIYTAVRPDGSGDGCVLFWALIGDRGGGEEDAWLYPDEAAATAGLIGWDAMKGGEPTGWHKHPKSGR